MRTAVGVFDLSQAGRVIDDLCRSGFGKEHLSVIAHPHEAALGVDDLSRHIEGLHETASPEVGGLYVSGPLGDRFAGANLRRELVASGLSEAEAARYIDSVKQGGAIVAAEVPDDDLQRALDLMTAHTRGEREGAAPAGTAHAETPRSPAGATRAAAREAEDVVIPVVQEQMRVGKREVESGGVKITPKMSEETIEKPLSLRDEKVSVERRKVDRPASEADRSAGGRTFETRERHEEPVIEKTSQVVEEVVVHKETAEHPETVRGTVRRDDVAIDPLHNEAARFGGTLRERGAGQWSAVESDAQREWETKQPGTWDRIKASVRNAFERPGRK